jgi:hypothetical protein
MFTKFVTIVFNNTGPNTKSVSKGELTNLWLVLVQD